MSQSSFADNPVIARLHAERAAREEPIKQKARDAWAKATPNQKVGVRLGMFDVDLLKAGGMDPYKDPDGLHRIFTRELMECATKDGGMRG